MKRMLALLAIMAIGVSAVNATELWDNTGDIDVNVTVLQFVEIEVIDDAINFDSLGTGFHHNDLSGMGNTPGVHRARFEVRANGNYNLSVTPSNGTWQATNLLDSPYDVWNQVKYLAANGDYIGGTLYLDRTPDIGTITHYWDGNTGSLVTGTYGAEVHTWGLSAGFAPDLYNANGDTGGTPNTIAPPATYSCTATITATALP